MLLYEDRANDRLLCCLACVYEPRPFHGRELCGMRGSRLSEAGKPQVVYPDYGKAERFGDDLTECVVCDRVHLLLLRSCRLSGRA